MNRKNMPLILMLTAGVITCIITFIQKYTVLAKLVSLFVVLVVFWFLGSVLKWTLDYFDMQNEQRARQEKEEAEREAAEAEAAAQEAQEEAQENSPDGQE